MAKMKKIKFLSGLALLEGELSLGSGSFGYEVPEWLDENELFFVVEDTGFVPTLRFVVTSDTHISTEDGNTADQFKTIMNQIADYVNDPNRNDGYDKLDAIAIAGDITGAGNGDPGGTEEEFRAAKNVFESVLPEGTKLVLAMGNHDYGNVAISGMTDNEINASIESHRNDFEDVFDTKAAQMVDINGFYFVTVDVDAAEGRTGQEYSAASVATLEGHLKDATAVVGSDMPIFVFQHVGNYGTILGTGQDAGASNYSTALYDVHEKYSNAIVFSGHTHVPINDECSIHQKDFTSINTGAISGVCYPTNSGNTIGVSANITKPYPRAVYVVEADADGHVKVRMWHIEKNDFFGEEWMIDSYNKNDFQYTTDRFTENALFFADGAEITVTPTSGTAISVSFLPVPTESLTARAYEVTLTDSSGAVSQKYITHPYFIDSYREKAITVAFDDLIEGTTYTVSVRAANPLYNMDVATAGTFFSQPITCQFTLSCGDALMDHDYWSDYAAVVDSDITEITYLDIPSGARFGPPSTFTTTFTCDKCGKQTVVTFNNPSSCGDSSHAYRYTSSEADLCAIISYEPLEDNSFYHNIWVSYRYKDTPLYCASNVDTNCTGITGDYCLCGRPGEGT